eukprot:6961238-Alexandrium_andersonii.AAC.1
MGQYVAFPPNHSDSLGELRGCVGEHRQVVAPARRGLAAHVEVLDASDRAPPLLHDVVDHVEDDDGGPASLVGIVGLEELRAELAEGF